MHATLKCLDAMLTLQEHEHNLNNESLIGKKPCENTILGLEQTLKKFSQGKACKGLYYAVQFALSDKSITRTIDSGTLQGKNSIF